MAELKPANENPWYVLMTLNGEQKGQETDAALHEKNRESWAAWRSNDLRGEARSSLFAQYEYEMHERNSHGFPIPAIPDTGEPLDLRTVRFANKLVVAKLEFRVISLFAGSTFENGIEGQQAIFWERTNFDEARFMGKSDFFQTTFNNGADFNRTLFNTQSCFQKSNTAGSMAFGLTHFNGSCDFAQTTFRNEVLFSQAKFSERADFSSCQFQAGAGFNGAKFDGDADFAGVTFGAVAHFEQAKFLMDARFGSTEFKKTADFSEAIIGQNAFFGRTIFDGFALFKDVQFGLNLKVATKVSFALSQFKGTTKFEGATFYRSYPDFSGAILHDRTTFPAQASNWPQGRQDSPVQAKTSCAVMRQVMGKQGLPEEEHFFFRREMGFATQIGGFWQRLPYRFFGVVSDFGYSIQRPFLWLFWLWLCVGFFGFFLPSQSLTGEISQDWVDLVRCLALSFCNLFNFLGLTKIYFDVAKDIPAGWQQLLAGFQAVVGVVLLFFLGLGLRTRFRLR